MSFLSLPHFSRLIGWEQRTAVANRQTDTTPINIYIYIFQINIMGNKMMLDSANIKEVYYLIIFHEKNNHIYVNLFLTY